MKNETKHSMQLDGLRFFAVSMVMIGHWHQWKWTHPLLTFLPLVHGVTLFFVLSGFLITRILLSNRDALDETSTSKTYLIKSFYIRRVLRIFPIYYLLLFFLFFIDYKNTRELFPWLISYTSNIYESIHNDYVGDFNHLWSLAVEEHFYLFWPLLIVFVPSKKILNVIVGTIILSLCVKAFILLYTGKWMAASYFTLSCMYALAVGALLAYLMLYQKELTQKLAKPFVLYLGLFAYLMLLAFNFYFKINWFKDIFDDFFFSLLAALIILRASTDSFKWGLKYVLENRFIVYSGKISYGIYLYHLFIPTLFYAVVSPLLGIQITNNYTLDIAFYFLTFSMAYLSWVFVEKPINALKTKVPYLKRSAI